MRRFRISTVFFLFLVTILKVHASDSSPLEYRLPAVVDSQIIGDRMTEVWGALYLPDDFSSYGTQKYPLVLFVHGDHNTCMDLESGEAKSCEYTMTGSCPSGSVPHPNHLGYTYAARELTSLGYIVLSVNANRGLTCAWDKGGFPDDDRFGMQARGNLILKHLSYLSEWNQSQSRALIKGVELQGRIDFNRVGMMGHSIGGGSVRSAYESYLLNKEDWQNKIQDRVHFTGIFEMGGGSGDHLLDRIDVPWAYLASSCDIQVPTEDALRVLSSFNQIESQTAPQMVMTVGGANHSFFNTYWRKNWSTGCINEDPLFDLGAKESKVMQRIGKTALVEFFQAANQSSIKGWSFFDPQYKLPEDIESNYHLSRFFSDSSKLSKPVLLDDLKTSKEKNSRGVSYQTENLELEVKDLLREQKFYQTQAHWLAMRLFWSQSDQPIYFQTEFSVPEDLSSRSLLSLTLLPDHFNKRSLVSNPHVLLQLVQEDGSLSTAFDSREQVEYLRPTGDPYWEYQAAPQAIRVPLDVFKGVDFSKIKGVRILFDQNTSGSLFAKDLLFY